ncbi:NAD(P)-binding oxidoreductase [Kribbella sp. NPDC050459]|uniref:NAD(P)-dependent oxidoreductase n=1 Tax=Kribbella sp. NPDC050459 TaxID=3155785 RepID=UPI0033EA5500
MKLTVLGATGQTGLLLVEQALSEGHQVTALVRRKGNLPDHPNLTIRLGELNDSETMTDAITGSEAVISCLGPAPGRSSSLKKHSLMRTAVPAILASMTAAGVSRLILLSALGVGNSARITSPVARFAYKTVAKTAYDDKQVSERSLTTSNLDWTLVYPGVLTNARTKKSAVVRDLSTITKIPGLPKVTRSAVAATLLDVAASPAWIHKTAVITS